MDTVGLDKKTIEEYKRKPMNKCALSGDSMKFLKIMALKII